MLSALLLSLLAQAAPAVQVVTVDEPVVIDGVLDEAAWERAAPVTDFVRFIPTAGGAPDSRTEVRFLQDDRHLYVGIRVAEADYRIRARISVREEVNADDQIGIYLDTFRDQRSGYVFYLNPLGIQQDIRYGSGGWNQAWDTVFTSRGRVTDDGYELEIAFPFRSLKFPSGAGAQEWGLILTRKIPEEGAKYSFPPTERNHPFFWSQAAPLVGVRPPRRGSGLELVPGLTAVQEGSRAAAAEPMTWTGFDAPLDAVRPALDARLGVTPNIGLTAALNPDFSQVENDETPIDLNQRFAYSFPERRPFFLEGREYFDDRFGTLYSRSIVEPLYGVKVAGKEGRWAVGALNALDRSPGASFHEDGAPGFDPDDVEDALAASSMLRIAADAFETGHVGVTLADKRLIREDGEPAGRHQLGAVDLEIPLGDRWGISGGDFQSWTDGGEGEALWGHGSSVSLYRQSGVGTGFSLGLSDFTPGARYELGYMPRSGLSGAGISVNHTFEPDAFVDTWTPWAFGGVTEERGGDAEREVEAGVSTQLADVHWADVWAERSQQIEDGVEVRGWELGAAYWGQVGSWLEWGPTFEVQREIDYDLLVPALATYTWLGAVVRPTTGLRLDAGFTMETFSPEGEAVERATRTRLKANWQFTRTLGLRVIGELTAGSDLETRSTSSLLLTWLLHPGTAAWIGYAETTILGVDPYARDRTVFAKLTVLARP